MQTNLRIHMIAAFVCIISFQTFGQTHFEIFGGYRIEGDLDLEGDRFTSQTSTLFFLDSFQISSQIEQAATPFLKVFPNLK